MLEENPDLNESLDKKLETTLTYRNSGKSVVSCKSDPLRLITTICKHVQERGCEKYGRVVIFVTFMKESHKN